MTARLARVALSTGAAALALGLVAPSVALAEERTGDAKAAKTDPRGNNGTIKINPFGRTDGKANHPQPGCDFRLSLFGFDGGQTGTVTFVGQAPTKDAVTKQPLSGSVALAGATRDNKTDTFYDIRGAQLGLTGTPAKQGFHVKVLVDADNAPGGAKQKVFWLDCPAAVGGAVNSTASTVTTSSVTQQAASGAVSGATSGAATAASAGAATSTLTKGRVAANSRTSSATEFTGGSAAAAVGGATPAATALGGATPAAATQDRGSALPFTGLPLPVLLTLALGALAAGALAIRAGRRRTADLG